MPTIGLAVLPWGLMAEKRSLPFVPDDTGPTARAAKGVPVPVHVWLKATCTAFSLPSEACACVFSPSVAAAVSPQPGVSLVPLPLFDHCFAALTLLFLPKQRVCWMLQVLPCHMLL